MAIWSRFADSLDTRSAAGRLVLNIMVSVSQWEREAIVDCALVFHGESYGWECQCLVNGELADGQRFVLRVDAFEEAEAQRRRLMGEGWTAPVTSCPTGTTSV